MLEKHPRARVKVLVIWSLIRNADSQRAAQSASAYLPDPRAEHFWDLWNFSVKNYTQQLRFPADQIAWNIFVLYKPHLVWRERAPEPSLWMQSLGLDHGTPYSPEQLEKELQRWIIN